MKQKIIITSAMILIFIVGLSVLLYPVVSDYLNSLSQSRAIAQFNDELVRLSEADYSEIMDAAREYNRRLMSRQNRFVLTEADLAEYHRILDFTGRGIIGTLEIAEINVMLPVYLTTEESVLQVGIGHLVGSSLPIGGPGTHSVVTGHRGLPSSTLLTNMDKLREGDVFVLRILNEELHYEIDNIVIVDPGDFGTLGIDPEKEYSTLLTCTPYGINSHRLLLRGFRIFPEIDEPGTRVRIIRGHAQNAPPVAGYVISAVPVLFLSAAYISVKTRVFKRKR
jgi:sortase A